ncbi:unnamed protein product, partial [Protopolystoma xenopodis]
VGNRSAWTASESAGLGPVEPQSGGAFAVPELYYTLRRFAPASNSISTTGLSFASVPQVPAFNGHSDGPKNGLSSMVMSHSTSLTGLQQQKPLALSNGRCISNALKPSPEGHTSPELSSKDGPTEEVIKGLAVGFDICPVAQRYSWQCGVVVNLSSLYAALSWRKWTAVLTSPRSYHNLQRESNRDSEEWELDTSTTGALGSQARCEF